MNEPTFPGVDQIKELKCCDCGGWPIDDGAAFMAVFVIKKGKPVLGGMCELCWLKRCQRRGQWVNMSSGPSSQVHVPEMGITRREPPRGYGLKPKR